MSWSHIRGGKNSFVLDICEPLVVWDTTISALYVWSTVWKWDALSPVKVSVCVSSPRRTAEGREAITSRRLWRWLWRHCWGPAVVNMEAPGANRAKRSTPPPPHPPEPANWAVVWPVPTQHLLHLSEAASEPDLHPSPSVVQPLFLPLPSLKPFSVPLPHTVRSGLLGAPKKIKDSSLNRTVAFELQKAKSVSPFSNPRLDARQTV